jgi:hypothetical protein
MVLISHCAHRPGFITCRWFVEAFDPVPIVISPRGVMYREWIVWRSATYGVTRLVRVRDAHRAEALRMLARAGYADDPRLTATVRAMIRDARPPRLYESATGSYLREATQDELAASRAAGADGMIFFDGRRCFVAA